MIRRDVQSAEGTARWVLIPQIDHAHLAGDLADAWRFDDLPGPFLADLRYASRHHDDGWHDWDERPGVDSAGMPVNFDAMQLADSLSIWGRSIEFSTKHSPLAGYLVAGHFSRLLERFDSWKSSPATLALASEFLATQRTRMDVLLSTWQPVDQSTNRRELAELGVSYVQLFDAFSLALCTRERTQPWQVTLGGGESWTLTPLAADRVAIAPWPFALPTLTVRARGRSIEQARYATTDELLAAPSEPIELIWDLVSNGLGRDYESGI